MKTNKLIKQEDIVLVKSKGLYTYYFISNYATFKIVKYISKKKYEKLLRKYIFIRQPRLLKGIVEYRYEDKFTGNG